MKKHCSSPTRIIIVVLTIVIVVSAPVIINRAYMLGSSIIIPNTVFNASDMLMYCGSIISALGTVFLGIIAIDQNRNAHKLNIEFLSFEKSRNMSPISIREVREQPPENALKKGYIVAIGEDDYFQFDSNNNLLNSTCSPVCLLMKNVGERPIISFTLEAVRIQTHYNNGQSFKIPQDIVSRPLSNTILIPNDEIYMILSNIPYYSPPNFSPEKLLQLDFTNRIDEVSFTFKLENNAGRFYTEVIEVHLSSFPSSVNEVHYPIVISSKITSLDFT